ncbi:MAG: T9SS type A sorting domain-containing protein [Flavobacteriales bacterium]|nr:T9SS type A sorting domain-containing protein [Flavobacteriales bacterium]
MNLKALTILLICCVLGVFESKSQSSIVVDTVIQTSFCAGGSVVIPYALPGGDLNFGNVFTAQLSGDLDLLCLLGNFGNPIEIGVLPFWSGGFMLVQIPDSITLGTYRVRIISSNPPDTSNISPNCVLITNLPEAIFTITANPLDDTICSGDSVELSVFPLPAAYLWSTGETTPSIWVSTSGSYTVTVRDTLGCETESEPYLVEFETCLGVKEQQQGVLSLGAHPVPSSSAVEITFKSNEAEELQLSLYNTVGELVIQNQFNSRVGENNTIMDLSALPNGVYLLKVAGTTSFKATYLVRQ